MADSEHECFPDPEGMTEEEKIELIHNLHHDNHEFIDKINEMAEVVASGGNAMVVIAKDLRKGDKKGKRTRAMSMASAKLDTIGRMTLAWLGITPEAIREAAKFGDIVSQLEDDPEFNPEVPDDEAETNDG